MTPRKLLPSQTYLQECFTYSPVTGILIWRHRPRSHFNTYAGYVSINKRQAGKVAGTVHYSKRHNRFTHWVQVAGKTYATGRIIVKLVYDIEQEDVDHEDKNATNMALNNLRPCTHADNVKNKRTYKNNTSGAKGVYFHAAMNKYMACIYTNNIITYEYFDTVESARIWRNKILPQLHGSFACFD